MSQKTNPISLRLQKSNKHFSSCWYSDYFFSQMNINDLQIRSYIENISEQIGHSQAFSYTKQYYNRFYIYLLFLDSRGTRHDRERALRLVLQSKESASRHSALPNLPLPLTRGGLRSLFLQRLFLKESATKKGVQTSPQELISTLSYQNRSNLVKQFPDTQVQAEQSLSFVQRSLFRRAILASYRGKSVFRVAFDTHRDVIGAITQSKQKSLRSSCLLSRLDKLERLSMNTITRLLTNPSVLTVKRALKTFSKESSGKSKVKAVSTIPTGKNKPPREKDVVDRTIPPFSSNTLMLKLQTDLLLENVSYFPLSVVLFTKQICLQRAHNLKGSNLLTRTYPFCNAIESALCQLFSSCVSVQPIRQVEDFQLVNFLVCEIASFLQRGVSFKQIREQILKECLVNDTIRGIRLSCSGRAGGRSKKAQKSRMQSVQWGETSLHVFKSKVSFAKTNAETPSGKVGIKAWLCYK